MSRRFWLVTILPTVELILALGAAGLWYSTGGAIWYRAGSVGFWPVLLLALLWLARRVTGAGALRPSIFTMPLVLFLISALIGVWAAYDPGPAWAKFGLMLGALGLYWALAHQPDLPHLYVALGVLGVLATGLALYFLAGNTREGYPDKFVMLAQMGRRIAAALPDLPGHRISPNVAGGLLATLLPLYIPLLVLPWTRGGLGLRRRWLRLLMTLFWFLCGLVTAVGLFLSVSRGAWVALIAMAGLWLIWRFIGWCMARLEDSPERAWRRQVVTMVSLVVLGVAFLALLAYVMVLAGLPGAEAIRNRLGLQRDALLLARDYLLTGAGLGTFQMQFSIYTLLIHVGYIVYSHNMLLDLFIEQGLLGLLSYLWLAGLGLYCALHWQRKAPSATAWLLQAGLACLGVGLIHGLVDDVQYGSRGLLLLWLPYGLLLAVSRWLPAEPRRETATLPQAVAGRGERRRLLLGAVPAILLVALGARPAAAMLYAGLGAVEQSRVELRRYDPTRFAECTMDQVRQQENLDRAMGLFLRALALDPGQVTARQRLAAIALSRDAYGQARAQMEVAWQAGHRDSVTRLLLSDALVPLGEVDRAAEIARGLPRAVDRLAVQAWSRYYARHKWAEAQRAWETILLLDPRDTQAKYWLSETEKRLAGQ